jgi:hypothetical protein
MRRLEYPELLFLVMLLKLDRGLFLLPKIYMNPAFFKRPKVVRYPLAKKMGGTYSKFMWTQLFEITQIEQKQNKNAAFKSCFWTNEIQLTV